MVSAMILLVGLIFLSSTAIMSIEAQTMQTIITSDYTSALTTDNAKVARPGTSSADYYYEAIEVMVTTSGTYTFKSSSGLDTFGFLYNQSFDESYPTENLIIEDDQSGGSNQFQFSAYLEADVPYVLVVSTYNANSVGPYSVVASGPDNVFYTSMNISQTITTTTQIATTEALLITATYSNVLTVNSGNYTRYGQSSGLYYYHAIEVRVATTGSYTFKTSSTISDTYGYLYQGNFYSSYPQYNIVTSNDDAFGNSQFGFTVTLRSDLIYILVFTTYSAGATGSFNIVASGPSDVLMNPINVNSL